MTPRLVRGYQSQVKKSDQMGGSRPIMRALHSRPEEYTERSVCSKESAGVLSRGVGLRGFESHPPHQNLTRWFGRIIVNSPFP